MSKTLDFLKYFIPFSIILFGFQYYIMDSLSEKYNFFYEAWSIYLFNIAATFVVYLLLIYIHKNVPTYTGFTFLGASFFRMMLAIIFLIPLIKGDVKSPIVDLSTFFIPYFLFLLFETYFTIRLINKG